MPERSSGQAVRIALGFVLALVISCAPLAPVSTEERASPGTVLNSRDFARSLLVLIASDDLEALAAQVDPVLGLTFSPYAYIEIDHAVTIPAAELSGDWRRNESYTWGARDGSGEPINLSVREYFADFVYDRDYLEAPEVAVNRRIGQGNTIDNIGAVYAGMTVVEFHFPGQEARYAGLDWSSLRCVLRERYGGGWWLVALVHDQWTI